MPEDKGPKAPQTVLGGPGRRRGPPDRPGCPLTPNPPTAAQGYRPLEATRASPASAWMHALLCLFHSGLRHTVAKSSNQSAHRPVTSLQAGHTVHRGLSAPGPRGRAACLSACSLRHRMEPPSPRAPACRPGGATLPADSSRFSTEDPLRSARPCLHRPSSPPPRPRP